MYIDTHCHLNFKAFEEDWEEIADEAVKAGVEKMIVVGADLETSARAVELAEKHQNLFASVGIHPHHAHALREMTNFQFSIFKKLESLAMNKKVAAIGECGLDYHEYKNTKYENGQITPEIKVRQKRLFGQQIQLAKKLGLAMIIHNREAGEETLDTLKHFCTNDGQYPRGVFHCISGSKKLLQKILDLGFYIGIDGNITYSQEVQALAAEVPLERILLETDAPYLSPRFTRGKQAKQQLRNTPVTVKIVAQFLAKLKDASINQIEAETSKNAKKLFNIQ